MQVLIQRQTVANHQDVYPGEIHDVSDQEARLLFSLGKAIPAPEKPAKAKAKPKAPAKAKAQ